MRRFDELTAIYRSARNRLLQSLQGINLNYMPSRKVRVTPTNACQFMMGALVEVHTGPFRGLQGVIAQFQSPRRAVLSITMLGRAVSLEVDAALLKEVTSQPASHLPPIVDPKIQAELHVRVEEINRELIQHLHRHPNDFYLLSPRRFELLVAELLRDMGHEVTVTPQTRDGGRDIFAVLRIPQGEFLTIVECKKYAHAKRIGPEMVQRLMWIADERDRASRSLVATTAFFTSGARLLEQEYKWRLRLADYDTLRDWTARYGTWNLESRTKLWLPRSEA